jgi:N-acyl-L-homoserine lactone synthetase
MIQVIDKTNIHVCADVLRAFSALRYEVFIEKLGWNLPCREPGFEEDQFDDDGAVYLIVTDDDGDVVGGARLLDTARRSLLAEIFPYLVDGVLPADPKIFEVTRFTAPTSRKPNGGSYCAELLWGLQAYGLWAGLSHLVSVSYLSLQPILRRAGYRFSHLGPVKEMDGTHIVALRHDVDASILERSRQRLPRAGHFLPSGHEAWLRLGAPPANFATAASERLAFQ